MLFSGATMAEMKKKGEGREGGRGRGEGRKITLALCMALEVVMYF